MKKILVVLVVSLLLCSCKQKQLPQLSFYYWKTNFNLSTDEVSLLRENKVKKLYIRYFDINLRESSAEAFPETPIRFSYSPNNFTVIPVVYIKNKVFLNSALDLEDLAQKTASLINQINRQNKISIKEIQLDCDWTISSKDRFFTFINLLKDQSHKTISATIRLHQEKYFTKTGIPPVSNGVLMYYNMGTLSAFSANSIYEKELANKYLKSLKNYPLHLKVALPIFSWAVHIRNHKVIGLKNKIDLKSLAKDTNFVRVDKMFFKVKNSNYKKGSFYHKNDLLKIETITQDDLLEMAEDLSSNLKQTPTEVIFYDLDQFNTQKYENKLFEKITHQF